MALNGSGAISIGGSTTGQSINLELSRSATATSSLNETELRSLCGVASGAISLSDFYNASAFEAYQDSLSTPGSGSHTIPTGASSLTISIWGAGSGGGKQEYGSDAGGGGGAFMQYTIAIAASDWGNSLSYTVGTKGTGKTSTGAGQGTSGSASSISGSLNAGSLSMNAGGGQNSGAGGTYSGNYDTATNGGNSSGNNGGWSLFSSGGIRGEYAVDNTTFSPYSVWYESVTATSGGGVGSGGGGGVYEVSAIYLNDPVDISGADGNNGGIVLSWS